VLRTRTRLRTGGNNGPWPVAGVPSLVIDFTYGDTSAEPSLEMRFDGEAASLQAFERDVRAPGGFIDIQVWS